MALTFTPLSPLFGATVTGLSANAPSEADAAALRDGLAKHKILSIPTKNAAPDDFLAIARAFGRDI